MGYKLEKFSAGTMDKGVSARTMDFQGEVNLTIDGYNLSQGLQQGLGPRPGMSPLPGHADNETISGTRMPGLRAAEGSPAQGYSNRLKVLAILPLTLGKSSAPSTKVNTYMFVVTRTGETLDVMLSSTTTDISANLYDGLPFSIVTYNNAPYRFLTSESVPSQNGSRAVPFANLYAYTSGKFYASVATLSVSGADVPMNWYVGGATSTGDASHAPNLALQAATAMPGPPFPYAPVVVTLGVPSEFNLQNYDLKSRSLNIFTIRDASAGAGSEAGFNTQYTIKFNPSASTMLVDAVGNATTCLNIDSIVATSVPVAGIPAKTIAALVEDAECKNNTSYKAALIAAQKPVAVVFQDSYSHGVNHPQQWFDLTQLSYNPPIFNSGYVEDTRIKQCPFTAWPAFVRGTAMTNYGGATAAYPTLGAANTGVLRANTVYEFTYSVFNKRLNFETNVAPKPVKFQTGTDEFVSLQLFNSNGSGGVRNTLYSTLLTGNFLIPFDFSNFTATGLGGEAYIGTEKFLNFYQYRFYYRQEGTESWLPALFMDAAQWWFYPHITINACTGAIAALPGGSPGAFNDYSNLSQDKYDCVVAYKDRAWWFSEKAINFSLRNNIFAYPARNSINAASGSFRGGLVHNYPGQAEQSSRLIIFGTRETYVARFTGNPAQANVQVSAESSGVFDIDGSDLEIDPWTSATAFSYRAATVAEGILYWWGPQGVFRDDGVQTPTRISSDLEPNLFSLYDVTKIDEIFANYNNTTKEIEWVYTPANPVDSNDISRSIIYNTVSGNWTPAAYTQKIDWMQQINIDAPAGTGGFRNIVGTRANAAATIQRAYFFDQKNRSGDMAPTRDWVVKTIATPSTGVRRLTLAAGYDATNFATMAIGDLIALQQTKKYDSSLTAASDMIAKIAAINTGTGTIDITLPTGASLDGSASPTFNQYFPIWHATTTARGLNGFNYSMPTNYWLPKGTNGYYFWLYCYLLAKMSLWKSDVSRGWTLGYRTPTASALISDFIAFADNSDGNFQVYHPLRPGNDNMEGAGLKFALSGVHIGHEWVLQYLEAHGTPIEGDPLKRFEG